MGNAFSNGPSLSTGDSARKFLTEPWYMQVHAPIQPEHGQILRLLSSAERASRSHREGQGFDSLSSYGGHNLVVKCWVVVPVTPVRFRVLARRRSKNGTLLSGSAFALTCRMREHGAPRCL